MSPLPSLEAFKWGLFGRTEPLEQLGDRVNQKINLCWPG